MHKKKSGASMTANDLQNRRNQIENKSSGNVIQQATAKAMQKALDARLAKTGGVVQRAGVSNGFDASGQANIEVQDKAPGLNLPLMTQGLRTKMEEFKQKAKNQYMQNNHAHNMLRNSSNGTGGGNPNFNSFATNNFGDISGANNFQNNPLPQDPDAMPGASMRGGPDKKFKPNKGSNNLHVETNNFAAKAGMGQGNIRGDRAITFDNIENVTTDNTYVKRFQKPIMAKKK